MPNTWPGGIMRGVENAIFPGPKFILNGLGHTQEMRVTQV